MEGDWRDAAACLGMDPNIFYPPTYTEQAIARAEIVCRGCEVKAECREAGKEERFGIWGGIAMVWGARRKRRVEEKWSA